MIPFKPIPREWDDPDWSEDLSEFDFMADPDLCAHGVEDGETCEDCVEAAGQEAEEARARARALSKVQTGRI